MFVKDKTDVTSRLGGVVFIEELYVYFSKLLFKSGKQEISLKGVQS